MEVLVLLLIAIFPLTSVQLRWAGGDLCFAVALLSRCIVGQQVGFEMLALTCVLVWLIGSAV